MKKLVVTAALAALGFTLARAVETQTWSTGDAAAFRKGKSRHVSIRSDGRIALSPAHEEVLDASAAYIPALAIDSKGRIYAGTGGPGSGRTRLTVVEGGKSRTLAELDGLQIQALAVDPRDGVYAATAPDGKVYRVQPDGSAEVFFDPRARYIWQMAFDAAGNLFVATGEEGVVYKVNPRGEGAVFFKTEETHARSVAVDGANLIVGTEPSGLIIRVSPEGKGFVLYQAPKSEVTALAVRADGHLFAAAVGDKRRPRQPAPPIPLPAPAQGPPGGAPMGPAQGPAGPVQPQPVPTQTVPSPQAGGGSEVYEITPDGFTQTIWSDSKELVYALALDRDGRPLIGTGNDGLLYRLDSQLIYTILWQAPASQITSLVRGGGGRLFAATGDVGKVFRIGPEPAGAGWLESDVFDAERFAYWGRLAFRGSVEGGSVRFLTRSGNLDRPQQNWTGWSAPIEGADGGRVESPPARFLQWRAELTPSSSGASPQIREVSVAYLARNVAPVISAIDITPANYQFPPQNPSLAAVETITLSPLGQKAAAKPKPAAPGPAQSMRFAKGWAGGRWSASDSNADDLVYTLYIKGVSESNWKLLKDKLEVPYYSWDSAAFPDGRYLLKVGASDSPSNPPDKALSHELTSTPFLIDNTAPRISGLKTERQGQELIVEWEAEDASSLLGRAEYSIDGGAWLFAEPVTLLTDSQRHSYKVVLKDLSPGEHTIAVRVEDEFRNQTVEKKVVTF